MDALNQGMQDELERIRYKDATKRRGSQSESAVAELEWKMHHAMITSGLVIGPLVIIGVVILVIWLGFLS
jgi:hypothetical protein